MITVFGSINVDFVVRVERHAMLGETILGRSFETTQGGKGANQALAARRAGSNVRLVGAVGSDRFADMALEVVRSAGVNLDLVASLDTETGVAVITVSDDGENTISVVQGANGGVSPAMVSRIIDERTQPGDILMLQMEIPASVNAEAIRVAKEKGMLVIFNTAPATNAASALALSADIVVSNESEFELLVGGPVRSHAQRVERLKQLHEMTSKTFVVTLGSEGAIAVHKGEMLTVPSLKIQPIDTVGAGDTFCGYLAAGIDAGQEFYDALRTAVVAGSVACLSQGAQPAIPMRSIVAQYM